MKNLKYPMIILIFLCVVAIGLGVKKVYDRTAVASPMEREALALPGIVAVELKDGVGKARDVYTTFSADAGIETVYPRLEQIAESTLGQAFGDIIIIDRRDEHLTEAFRRIHFALQEAISTGRFTRMIRYIEEELEPFSLDHADVHVTNDHVFVTMRDGDAYLHAVIHRQPVLAVLH